MHALLEFGSTGQFTGRDGLGDFFSFSYRRVSIGFVLLRVFCCNSLFVFKSVFNFVRVTFHNRCTQPMAFDRSRAGVCRMILFLLFWRGRRRRSLFFTTTATYGITRQWNKSFWEEKHVDLSLLLSYAASVGRTQVKRNSM